LNELREDRIEAACGLYHAAIGRCAHPARFASHAALVIHVVDPRARLNRLARKGFPLAQLASAPLGDKRRRPYRWTAMRHARPFRTRQYAPERPLTATAHKTHQPTSCNYWHAVAVSLRWFRSQRDCPPITLRPGPRHSLYDEGQFVSAPTHP